jgi:hypothetical protein
MGALYALTHTLPKVLFLLRADRVTETKQSAVGVQAYHVRAEPEATVQVLLPRTTRRCPRVFPAFPRQYPACRRCQVSQYCRPDVLDASHQLGKSQSRFLASPAPISPRFRRSTSTYRWKLYVAKISTNL